MLSQKLATLKALPYNVLTLDYPITRSYPWRWFGPLMLLSSIPVLLLLTVLNIFTVGTETITYESSEYRTGSTWLFDLVGEQAPTVCDPARLRIGDTLRTNFGVFDYTLVAINGSGGSKAWTWEAPTRRSFENPSFGFEYSGADLATSCYSTEPSSNIHLRFVSLFADLSAYTVQGEVEFYCLVGDGGIAQLRLSRLSRPATREQDEYDSKRTSPGRRFERFHTFTRAFVDRMADDVLQSVRLSSEGTNETSLSQVFVGSSMLCPDWQSDFYSAYDCPVYLKKENRMSGVASVVDRGHVRFVLPSSIEQASAGLQTSLSNYVAALYVTNLLDLGMWNSSPLLNREFFNRTFQANVIAHALSAGLAQHSSPAPVHLGSSALRPALNIYNRTLSAVSFFRNPPTYFINDQLLQDSRPVWAVSYTCHRTRLKKPLGLIVAVLVADASLFGLIWGIVMYLPTNIAQRRDNTCSACGSSTSAATAPAASSP